MPASLKQGRVLQRVIQIVAHEQVDETVTIEIKKRRRHAPRRGIVGAARCGNVGEGAVPVVVEHLVAAKSGEVQIDPAVVVDVADGDAHPVAARMNAARCGDVGEMERPRAIRLDFEIVAIQPVAERSGRRRNQGRAVAEHFALHEIDIEIAVVVVIEQRDARRHDFRLIELAGHAVEVHEVETDLVRAIGKPFARLLVGSTGAGWLRRAAAEEDCGNSQAQRKRITALIVAHKKRDGLTFDYTQVVPSEVEGRRPSLTAD